MKITTSTEALNYLYSLQPASTELMHPGELGLVRIKKLLELVGNPQEKIITIHIAGTSGKGSTSTFLARILEAHGYRTALKTSPHLLDFRERFVVNREMIPWAQVIENLNEIIPMIEEVKKSELGSPTYAEATSCLAYYSLAKVNPDVLVMETGMGGRYDFTNSIAREDKITVITRIGLDHTDRLGNTLEKIAWQKAGIIQNKNLNITFNQSPEVDKVFADEAREKNATQIVLRPEKNFSGTFTSMDFIFSGHTLKNIELGLIGNYQVENAALAMTAAIKFLERDDLKIEETKLRKAVKETKFPGRFTQINVKGKTVIFDGAHNPQKMDAFLRALKELYPQTKFNFLVGFKTGKDYFGMIKPIVENAQNIFISPFFTESQDFAHFSVAPEEINKLIKAINPKTHTQTFTNSKTAFTAAITNTDTETILVVTGSLYFISEFPEFFRNS